MIPYGRQDITNDDIREVTNVLLSDFLTQGPTVPKFEEAIVSYCDANYAVAVNSATSALHIACLAIGLKSGDYLWTSPNTFVASANCALYCGAKVDFVDIDKKTYNMCPEALEKKLKKAEKIGKLPKVVIPVHFAGQPPNIPKIFELSKKYGFKIIEDASHAIGASYLNYKVGSCKHSHITVFSFHPVKIITSGEGGIAVTNDKKLAGHMKRLRAHGITSDEELMSSRPASQIWNYQQIELGYNYRMTDIQAALGASQLTRLDAYISLRHEIAQRYQSRLTNKKIVLPHQTEKYSSSFHLFPVRIKGGKQRFVYQKMRENKIAVNLHYIPVHRHPFYKERGFNEGDFPEAERFFEEAISLPIFPKLGLSEQDHVIFTLMQAIEE